MAVTIVTVASKGAPLSATDFDNNMLNLQAAVEALQSGGGGGGGGSANQDTGSAAPTTGAWPLGWIRWNTSPIAGSNIGWVCIAAGTPGTWSAFGTISI